MSLNPAERCPELHQMLGAYLHQDFDLEFASAEEALAASVAEASPVRVAAATTELRAQRPPAEDEEATSRFVHELCAYHPPDDGLTYVAWLDHVEDLLDRAMDA